MVKVDQGIRRKFLKGGQWNKEIDIRNTKKMKDIVKKYGWPGKSLVGENGAHGAWLLIQHSVHDLKFQKKCLVLLKQAVKTGEASKKHLAYLIDRILVNSGKKQIYGTQFYKNKNGKLDLKPIRDRKNADKRRKKMGLSFLSQGIQEINKKS